MSSLAVPQIPFSILTVSQMLEVYNTLAKQRGVSPLKVWNGGRMLLVQKLAILRTQKIVAPVKPAARKRSAPIKKAPNKQPKRDAILKQLAIIDHYEDVATGEKLSVRTGRKRPPESVISVGLSYPAILKNLKADHGTPVLRLTASKVRAGVEGHTNCKLPQKRPHGEPKARK